MSRPCHTLLHCQPWFIIIETHYFTNQLNKEHTLGKLFLLFAILPIIEIAILINVGEQIGGWNTVFIVIITAFAGAHLVRQQGLSTLMQAQQKMQHGTMPGQEMAEGLLLVIAGVLLVTPGFITDGFGFLLSLPMTRPVIARALLKTLTVRVVTQSQTSEFHKQYSHQQNQDDAGSTDIIEGEFERKDDKVKDGLRKPD